MSFNSSYTTKPSLNDNQSNKKSNNIDSSKNFLHINKNDTNKKNNERCDKFGNLIKKNGKQKISFLDKIEKRRICEIIEIESYKEYNKMNDIKFNNNGKNNCCILF